jgi:hypothetical protein
MPAGISGLLRTSSPGGIPGGLLARRPALPAPPSPGTWDSSGPAGLLCRRRPERELAEAVQSLGVAEQVAGVTEQGQGLPVAGSGCRVVPGLCCTTAGAGWLERSALPAPASAATR